MEAHQNITTEENIKNEEDKKMSRQCFFLWMLLKTQFIIRLQQTKAPENRVEPIVLSDKDSNTEYKDANTTDDQNIPKMRA